MDILTALNIGQENFGTCSGDGEWLKTVDQGQLISINPSNEIVLGKVYLSSEQDQETIINKAQAFAKSWRILPAPQRGELIYALGQVLRQQKDFLGSLIALEMGKSKQEGDGEVQEMIDMADFAVGQARMLYGKTIASERSMHRLYEQWHPLGIVLVITAFNFPMAVWAWNAFLGAITGNVIIWKPSHKVPLCAIAIQNICNQVMQRLEMPGIFSLIMPAQHAMVERYLSDARINLISFTGSTKVGKKVAALVVQRLGKCLLELGGNNAIIVDETANLALALHAIVFGAIGTAGQRCTTTRRLFIHQSIYQTLVARLGNAYQQISIGDPLQPNILMGPLIDQAAVTEFESAIREVKQAGGKVLFGGQVLPGPGFFVQPTLVRVENHWPLVQRETFAPILYVMEYQDFSDAIAQQNAVSQGLSSALFTNSLQNAELFLSVLGSDCGIANINLGTSGAEIGGAFGGEKDSGSGREAGSDAWQAYMRRQTNTINWGSALPLAQGIKFAID